MNKIFSSASKIVFLLLTITACISFGLGILGADHFMVLASSAFAFYFSNKGNSNDYLGK